MLSQRWAEGNFLINYISPSSLKKQIKHQWPTQLTILMSLSYKTLYSYQDHLVGKVEVMTNIVLSSWIPTHSLQIA
jgi:hypothetical protein